MAAVANEEGVTVELERDGTIFRVMPFHPPAADNPSTEADRALTKWIADQELTPAMSTVPKAIRRRKKTAGATE